MGRPPVDRSTQGRPSVTGRPQPAALSVPGAMLLVSREIGSVEGPVSSKESAMAGTSVVVVPAGFEKRPADRVAFATCWLVDAAMGLVMGLGVTVFLGGLLTPFSLHPGAPGEQGEMSAWAVSLAVAAGCAVAVGCMAFRTGGPSVGHMVAGIPGGRPDQPAGPGRDFLR